MILSCVILNYNVSDMIVNLVKKIEKYKVLDYIVIVDNCSTDGSYEKLIELQSSRIRVIKTEKNGGYGYGNNYGIRFSWNTLKSDRVLICGPDVEFSEESVIAMVEALDKNKQIAMATCVPFLPNGKFQRNAFWDIPTVFQSAFHTCSIWNRLTTKSYFYSLSELKDNKTCYIDCVLGSFMLIDTSTMMKYGMYDEDIFLYCEETVLGIKFKRANYKTIVLLDREYIHHHSVAIKKSVNSEVRRHKLLIESKLKVLQNYFNLHGIKLLIVKCIFCYAIIERMIISILKKNIISRTYITRKIN